MMERCVRNQRRATFFSSMKHWGIGFLVGDRLTPRAAQPTHLISHGGKHTCGAHLQEHTFILYSPERKQCSGLISRVRLKNIKSGILLRFCRAYTFTMPKSGDLPSYCDEFTLTVLNVYMYMMYYCCFVRKHTPCTIVFYLRRNKQKRCIEENTHLDTDGPIAYITTEQHISYTIIGL